jgi:hypothetical protein
MQHSTRSWVLSAYIVSGNRSHIYTHASHESLFEFDSPCVDERAEIQTRQYEDHMQRYRFLVVFTRRAACVASLYMRICLQGLRLLRGVGDVNLRTMTHHRNEMTISPHLGPCMVQPWPTCPPVSKLTLVHLITRLLYNTGMTFDQSWHEGCLSETVRRLFRDCSETVQRLFRDFSETVRGLVQSMTWVDSQKCAGRGDNSQ